MFKEIIDFQIIETTFPDFQVGDFEALLSSKELTTPSELVLFQNRGMPIGNSLLEKPSATVLSIAPANDISLAAFRQLVMVCCCSLLAKKHKKSKNVLLQTWKDGNRPLKYCRLEFANLIPWDPMDVTRNLNYESMEMFFGE